MDDIFMQFATLSSRLSNQFIHFVEDLVYRDVERLPQHSQFPFFLQKTEASCHIYQSVTGNGSLSSNSTNAGICLLNSDRGESDDHGCFSVNTKSDIPEKQRLYLSSSALEGLASRVKRSLQGSSQEIGWLECSGLPPVEDGTSRFMELLDGIRKGEHSLPNSFIYLFVPGLFSNHSPMYFVHTKKFFSNMGLAFHMAKIHSEASVEKNAWELKKYIEELYLGSGKRVLILGHSKGGVDAAAALSIYWTDLKDKVAGLALVQSPYGGSPVASDLFREGQFADKKTRRILEFLVDRLVKGDVKSMEDLTHEKRKEFIANYVLPTGQIPLVSFHTEASLSPSVLASLSHVGDAELPWLPASFGSEANVGGWRVPLVAPLAAMMAACTLIIWLRYGERSDGLVTRRDAEVPGSVVVRLDRKLDHCWMAYTSRQENHPEADACELSEALFTLLVELGKTKQAEQAVPWE